MLTWEHFVAHVIEELRFSPTILATANPIEREQDLTRAVACRLRAMFSEAFSVSGPDLSNHVTYRQGDTDADRAAWRAAQPDKWVEVHGLNFVPDVLIRRTFERGVDGRFTSAPCKSGTVVDALPIEIKLVTSRACSQALATSVGQALMYRTRFAQAVIFVGVVNDVAAAHGLLNVSPDVESQEHRLRTMLDQQGVTLITRAVNAACRQASHPGALAPT